jgi:hypothetical protein
MGVYAREHLGFAWLVDPLAQTLEAFRLEGERWLQLGAWIGDAKLRAEPFESFELELAALWER